MKRLYGNIPGINYEEEYEIIRRTLELERERLAENKATPFKDLFVGQNKYRMLVMVYYTLAMHWGGMPLISTFGTCEITVVLNRYEPSTNTKLQTSSPLLVSMTPS